MSEETSGQRPQGRPQFSETHWSLVLAAANRASPGHLPALETLCAHYWYPLYAYVRRRGYGVEDAKDLTQAFFTRVIEKDYLRTVDGNKGRFRSFLLGAMNHFLANEWDRQMSRKLGTTPGNVAVKVNRMRKRYRELVEWEIAQTVSNPQEIEKEKEHLLACISQ